MGEFIDSSTGYVSPNLSPKTYIDRQFSDEPLPPDLAEARAEDARRIAEIKHELAETEEYPMEA